MPQQSNARSLTSISTSDNGIQPARDDGTNLTGAKLNRVDEVRHELGLSRRQFANEIGETLERADELRDPRHNALLSEYHELAAKLREKHGVEVQDLVVDPTRGELSQGNNYPRMLRIVKTLRALQGAIENSSEPGVGRMMSQLLRQFGEVFDGERRLSGLTDWLPEVDDNGRRIRPQELDVPPPQNGPTPAAKANGKPHGASGAKGPQKATGTHDDTGAASADGSAESPKRANRRRNAAENGTGAAATNGSSESPKKAARRRNAANAEN